MNLPDHWTTTTLAEAVEPGAPIVYGILQPGPDLADGVPYIRPTEIQRDRIQVDQLRRTSEPISEKYERSQLKGGDVILSIVGTIGKVAVVPASLDGANITQSSARLRPDHQLTVPGYLDWALRSPQLTEQFGADRLGTAVPRLNLGHVRSFDLPIAPAPEQRRIVAKIEELFSELDSGVAALERAQTRLERYRASVLQAAVEGRLTEAWRRENPPEETGEELLERISRPPRPNRYSTRTSDVIPGHAALSVGATGEELPPGWVWSPIVDVARLETGHTPSRKHPEWWDGDVPWIGIKDARAHHGGEIHDTNQKTNEEGLANSSARLLPTGTVCLSRTASVGYVVVMGRPMATSQDFVNWVCTEALNPKWLQVVFMADEGALRRFGRGSTHTTIYFTEVLSLHVAVPPRAEQDAIVHEVERLLTECSAHDAVVARAMRKAETLRPSILRRAFEGRLVPQDPDDEPASVLLERIRAERDGQPKKQRQTAPSSTDQQSLNL